MFVRPEKLCHPSELDFSVYPGTRGQKTSLTPSRESTKTSHFGGAKR